MNPSVLKPIPNELNPGNLEEVMFGSHELIDRKVWINDPAALEETRKETDGLIRAGAWNYENVAPRAQIDANARAAGQGIAIGSLLAIVSWKNAGSESLRKVENRHCFRGGQVRDALGQYAELQEIKVIPTTISGLNISFVYGLRAGCKSTQRDIRKAYVQSDLKTRVPTYVEIPPEMIPPEPKGIHRPCTRLYKSLYGHPVSGGHWAIDSEK